MSTPQPSTSSEHGPGPERKSDRTRRRILDAAAEVLSTEGFGGVRVADIAERAGLRISALYYYFDTREDLLAEVVTIGGQLAYRNVTTTLDALPSETGPLDRLCAAFAAHLETVLREPAYATAAIRTMGQLPPEIRERQLPYHKRSGELWRTLVGAAVDAGEIDPALHVHAARMLLMGAMNWAPEWWDPSRGSIEDTVATARRLVRNSLTASHGIADL